MTYTILPITLTFITLLMIHKDEDINKKINFDLKNIISLNTNKTEIILSRTRKKQISKNIGILELVDRK